MKKKFSLEDYVKTEHSFSKSTIKGVGIRFTPNYKNKGNSAQRLSITLSSLIIQKLKWKRGDKILFYHHKKEWMDVALIKSDNDVGVKISGSKNAYRVSVTLKKSSTKFPSCSSYEVDYEIHNEKYISFNMLNRTKK